ncbi:arginase family protein [Amycolatopsis sp. FDAARGOS 1241]|uniref:arginase family protein n=1 Tax=Amycolatopsis sp. FDAARGOS 1241 TaxID=2778070 RepID=UPI00194F6582|nr:arginase family protein [Amycolatopsis sp. FDAARGOS 1241]QRP44484.1 arginase family protein [Amycolatopsis sp. FDAARGOS 1241]
MLINAVPQWQGAVGPQARGLMEGCLALSELAGHVLGRPVHHIHQEPATSEVSAGVANRAVLTGANRAAQLAALEAPGGPVLTIGGDCGVELVPVGVARYRHGAGLGVAWFDAHPDLNTAESSPSGAFHGMVLRSLLGEGDEEFAASPAIEPGRVALFGTRVFDVAEEQAVRRGLAVQTEDVAGALRRAGAESVYLHVDLDVLDPGEFGGVNFPEPGGLKIFELVEAIAGLSEVDVVGAGITECVGTQLEALEPVITAVGRVLMRG